MKRGGPMVRSRGMSLIELLVVISVVGIITALAVPNISSISSQARFAKDMKNAQNIAGLLASAKAAGATNSWSDVTTAIDDLKDGISVAGPNGSLEFRISEMSEDEVQGASSNLTIVDGIVQYAAVTQ